MLDWFETPKYSLKVFEKKEFHANLLVIKKNISLEQGTL